MQSRVLFADVSPGVCLLLTTNANPTLIISLFGDFESDLLASKTDFSISMLVLFFVIREYNSLVCCISDSLPFGQKLKLIAKVCKHHLAPLLASKTPDITSPQPPAAASHISGGSQEGVFTKPSHPSGTSQSSGLFSPPPLANRDETNAKGL